MIFLEESLKHWREVAIAALLVICFGFAKDNKALRATINARPQIETHAEKKEDVKTTTGPVKTTERFAVSANCVPVLIERTIEAAPVVVEKIVEVSRDHSEKPACPAPRGDYQFLLGGSANPARAQDGQMIHVGVGIKDRLDLSYGHSVNGPERHDIRFVTRWGK